MDSIEATHAPHCEFRMWMIRDVLHVRPEGRYTDGHACDPQFHPSHSLARLDYQPLIITLDPFLRFHQTLHIVEYGTIFVVLFHALMLGTPT
jgi:hypothetical protein